MTDAIETTVTTGEGDETTIEAPETETPAAPGGPGDAAGIGSVVEFTITRGGGN